MQLIHQQARILKQRRLALALPLAVALICASANIAQADSDLSDANAVARSIAAVAPAQQIQPLAVSDSVAAGGISVTDDASGSLSFPGSGEQVEIGLPTSQSSSNAVVANDGTVVYLDDAEKTDVAVQRTTAGVRLQTIIRTPDAPSTYKYELSAGVEPEINADGSVFLAQSGSDLGAGIIAAPWAIDAAGTAVPTHYEVSGSTLTQVVDHSSKNLAYPIVADPDLSYCTLGGFYPAACVKYSKAEVKTMANLIAAGAGLGVIASAACEKLPTLYKVACRAAIATVLAAGLNNIATAARTGKCLAFTFSYPPIAQFLAGGLRIVSC